ncbi:MAG: hypothetical protein GX265_01605 [Mollicutes bacterium]|nr:hypothetical protein [Mollicutes bacterium]
MNNIIDVINEINNIFDTEFSGRGFLTGSYHDAVSFFTTGACWYYAYLLKQVFPEGKIIISDDEHHAIFELDGSYYDVTGIRKPFAGNYFVDDEVRGSPAYDHSDHGNVMQMIEYMIAKLEENSLVQKTEEKKFVK